MSGGYTYTYTYTHIYTYTYIYIYIYTYTYTCTYTQIQEDAERDAHSDNKHASEGNRQAQHAKIPETGAADGGAAPGCKGNEVEN